MKLAITIAVIARESGRSSNHRRGGNTAFELLLR